jgi:hypothetical protein
MIMFSKKKKIGSYLENAKKIKNKNFTFVLTGKYGMASFGEEGGKP